MISEESWRCIESPEGIHYNIVTRDSSQQTCKYCHRTVILRETPRVPLATGLTEWELTQVPVSANG